MAPNRENPHRLAQLLSGVSEEKRNKGKEEGPEG